MVKFTLLKVRIASAVMLIGSGPRKSSGLNGMLLVRLKLPSGF